MEIVRRHRHPLLAAAALLLQAPLATGGEAVALEKARLVTASGVQEGVDRKSVV